MMGNGNLRRLCRSSTAPFLVAQKRRRLPRQRLRRRLRRRRWARTAWCNGRRSVRSRTMHARRSARELPRRRRESARKSRRGSRRSTAPPRPRRSGCAGTSRRGSWRTTGAGRRLMRSMRDEASRSPSRRLMPRARGFPPRVQRIQPAPRRRPALRRTWAAWRNGSWSARMRPPSARRSARGSPRRWRGNARKSKRGQRKWAARQSVSSSGNRREGADAQA